MLGFLERSGLVAGVTDAGGRECDVLSSIGVDRSGEEGMVGFESSGLWRCCCVMSRLGGCVVSREFGGMRAWLD